MKAPIFVIVLMIFTVSNAKEQTWAERWGYESLYGKRLKAANADIERFERRLENMKKADFDQCFDKEFDKIAAENEGDVPFLSLQDRVFFNCLQNPSFSMVEHFLTLAEEVYDSLDIMKDENDYFPSNKAGARVVYLAILQMLILDYEENKMRDVYSKEPTWLEKGSRVGSALVTKALGGSFIKVISTEAFGSIYSAIKARLLTEVAANLRAGARSSAATIILIDVRAQKAKDALMKTGAAAVESGAKAIGTGREAVVDAAGDAARATGETFSGIGDAGRGLLDASKSLFGGKKDPEIQQ